LRINWNLDVDELEGAVVVLVEDDMETRSPEPDRARYSNRMGVEGSEARKDSISAHGGTELTGCCEAGDLDNFIGMCSTE
jgi:hypothetical protein